MFACNVHGFFKKSIKKYKIIREIKYLNEIQPVESFTYNNNTKITMLFMVSIYMIELLFAIYRL